MLKNKLINEYLWTAETCLGSSHYPSSGLAMLSVFLAARSASCLFDAVIHTICILVRRVRELLRFILIFLIVCLTLLTV